MAKYIIVSVIFVIACVIVGLAPWHFPTATSVAIPLATLALAFVAVLAILYNSSQENRRKQEARMREIIEWANIGYRLFSKHLPITSPGDRSDTVRELGELKARKMGMVTGAKMFNDTLLTQVKGVVEYLDLFINWLEEPFEKETQNKLEKLDMKVDDLKERIEESFKELLESAVNLRSELNL